MKKWKFARITALLLALVLMLGSLSGCLTTGMLLGVAALEKVRDLQDETEEESAVEETRPANTESSEKETEPPETETPSSEEESSSEKETETKETEKASETKETKTEKTETETEETETEEPETKDQDKPDDVNQAFHEFTDRVHGELLAGSTLTAHYRLMHPENFGIDTSDLHWYSMDVSDEAFEEYRETLDGYREELESFDYDDLDWEAQLTYDAFKVYLDLEDEGFGLDLLYEPLGPNAGIQAMLPVDLEEYKFYTESDVKDYIELIRLVPDYYEDIMNFEKEKADAGLFMEDDILENTLEQIEDFLKTKDDSFLITTFRERLEVLDLSKKEMDEYCEENEDAVLNSFYPAYEYLLEELPKLKGKNQHEGGLCNYPDGEKYFEYLLKATVGTDKTPDEMIKMLDQAIDESMNTITMLLRESPSLYFIFDDVPYPTTDPNLCLRILQNKILEDYPEIDDVDYEVDYVDRSLRDYLSPACYMIPPMDGNIRNSILINCDRGAEDEDIFITLAHEGYPGHLYQINYFQQNATYLLRDGIGTNGFAEGYATYVEHNAYHYIDDLSDDGAEVLAANARISLEIYARVDLGIHWQGWDVDDVEDYISDYFDGAKDAAQWMYDYMRADPGTYELYAIGELEILDIENEARDADDFDLKEFHKELLDCAQAPFPVIRKYILGE